MALPNQNFSKHLVVIYGLKIHKLFVILAVILKIFNKLIFFGGGGT
jgi:hypothetical protein